MANNSMWASTKSLMVVINYVNEIQLRDYRRALDAILDKSHEVLIWNQDGGLASLASINSTINIIVLINKGCSTSIIS
mgnify:CR=1 FL=1